MFVGMLLIILGVLLLLDHLGIIYGDVWDYFFPAAIVVLGIHLMVKGRSRKT